MCVHIVKRVVPTTGMVRIDDDLKNITARQIKVMHVVIHFVEKIEAVGVRTPANLHLDRQIFRVEVLTLSHHRVH